MAAKSASTASSTICANQYGKALASLHFLRQVLKASLSDGEQALALVRQELAKEHVDFDAVADQERMSLLKRELKATGRPSATDKGDNLLPLYKGQHRNVRPPALPSAGLISPNKSASFSSRASRATSASRPAADELRRRTVFGAMPRFSVIALRRRALTGSPPALERRLIGWAPLAACRTGVSICAKWSILAHFVW